MATNSHFKNNKPIALAIHGGAGAIEKNQMTAETEQYIHETMSDALKTGYEVLSHGGTSLDAVEKTIRVLEDSSLFNAGKGAVFTSAGEHELDAAMMDGSNLMAGMVAGVKHVKNPIVLARAVLEKSKHVLLVGEGAEIFAKDQGIELVSPEYFYSQRQWDKLQRAKLRELSGGNHEISEDEKHGTVGAVAVDVFGNLAAGTSTGGMTNNPVGRVGDSPILGAGTYANNHTCAVSATGHGEFFMRLVASYDISALMEYRGMGVQEAADVVILEKLSKMGGTGGVIAMDRAGNIAMPFNTQGMYRGYIRDGAVVTKIYRD